jgi:cytochrome P450
MYGIPVDGARIDRLAQLFAALGNLFAERRPGERRVIFDQLTSAVRAAGEEMLAPPESGGADTRSVLGEILRADPNHLRDETVIANLVLMVQATRGSVRGLLGWIVKELCDDAWWDGAGAVAPGGLEARATNVVNETLRRHQAEYFYRDVMRELRLGPYRIPKGWLLRVCMRESHDDPAVFPDPGRFDPGRFAARQYDRTEYCPFGDGPHACIGSGVSILIARTLVIALATDVDVRGVADAPPERAGNRHWSHWRPSPRFRVALRHREEPRA